MSTRRNLINIEQGYVTSTSTNGFTWCGPMNSAFAHECIKLGNRLAHAEIVETRIGEGYSTERNQHELCVVVKIKLKTAQRTGESEAR